MRLSITLLLVAMTGMAIAISTINNSTITFFILFGLPYLISLLPSLIISIVPYEAFKSYCFYLAIIIYAVLVSIVSLIGLVF